MALSGCGDREFAVGARSTTVFLGQIYRYRRRLALRRRVTGSAAQRRMATEQHSLLAPVDARLQAAKGLPRRWLASRHKIPATGPASAAFPVALAFTMAATLRCRRVRRHPARRPAATPTTARGGPCGGAGRQAASGSPALGVWKLQSNPGARLLEPKLGARDRGVARGAAAAAGGAANPLALSRRVRPGAATGQAEGGASGNALPGGPRAARELSRRELRPPRRETRRAVPAGRGGPVAFPPRGERGGSSQARRGARSRRAAARWRSSSDFNLTEYAEAFVENGRNVARSGI